MVKLDFSDPAVLMYGTEARKAVGALRALWAGDCNADGTLKYTGSANDRDLILAGIGGVVPTNIASGYLDEDVNLDGQVIYAGANNDRDIILQNIGGIVPTNTRVEQLP